MPSYQRQAGSLRSMEKVKAETTKPEKQPRTDIQRGYELGELLKKLLSSKFTAPAEAFGMPPATAGKATGSGLSSAAGTLWDNMNTQGPVGIQASLSPLYAGLRGSVQTGTVNVPPLLEGFYRSLSGQSLNQKAGFPTLADKQQANKPLWNQQAPFNRGGVTPVSPLWSQQAPFGTTQPAKLGGALTTGAMKSQGGGYPSGYGTMARQGDGYPAGTPTTALRAQYPTIRNTPLWNTQLPKLAEMPRTYKQEPAYNPSVGRGVSYGRPPGTYSPAVSNMPTPIYPTTGGGGGGGNYWGGGGLGAGWANLSRPRRHWGGSGYEASSWFKNLLDWRI